MNPCTSHINSLPPHAYVVSLQDKANKRRMLMAIDQRTKLLKNLRLVCYDTFEKVCEQLGITYTFPPEYYRRATRRWLAKKAFCIKVPTRQPYYSVYLYLLNTIVCPTQCDSGTSTLICLPTPWPVSVVLHLHWQFFNYLSQVFKEVQKAEQRLKMKQRLTSANTDKVKTEAPSSWAAPVFGYVDCQ